MDDGSGETARYFTVEAQMGKQVMRFDVPSQGFDGLAWVPKELGALATVEGRRYRHLVPKAFRLESIKCLRVVRAYGHTGWFVLPTLLRSLLVLEPVLVLLAVGHDGPFERLGLL